MIEYGDRLDVKHGPDDKERDVMCKTINSIFGELLGLKFGYEDLQCLTQHELYSFIQSSENLKKLYRVKIIY